MISVYAEKNLQSSFGGVPYAIAAAIFLVIGVSAFVSFLASALGAGPSGYDLDDGIVALVAFVVPGADVYKGQVFGYTTSILAFPVRWLGRDRSGSALVWGSYFRSSSLYGSLGCSFCNYVRGCWDRL